MKSYAAILALVLTRRFDDMFHFMLSTRTVFATGGDLRKDDYVISRENSSSATTNPTSASF
jgi:hypothetical protein